MEVNTPGSIDSFVRSWPSAGREIPRLLLEYESSLQRSPVLAASPITS